MQKRIVKWLMVGLLSCMLVGCGNQQETNNTEEPTTTETTTAPTEEPTEPPHEHTYTESITTEATCEVDGVKTFTCECGESYTEAITTTGHNYEEVADSANPATCDTDGKEVDTKCSICDSVVEGAVITASGHSYGEYVYNNDATTSADGTETATCSVCGGTDIRTKAGTKIEITYDGYDEFGNGYVIGADGYKHFDCACPYPINQITDGGSWVSYYGIVGQPQKDTDCKNILEDRYPGSYYDKSHRERIELGYYKEGLVAYKKWFY